MEAEEVSQHHHQGGMADDWKGGPSFLPRIIMMFERNKGKIF
jgi:hypothetical protein